MRYGRFITRTPLKETAEFNIAVKQHYRKGKLVRSFNRKGDKKKKEPTKQKSSLAKKALIGIGGVAGVVGGGLLVRQGMKARYLHNMRDFAARMKRTADSLVDTKRKSLSFQKYATDKKAITFTTGGYMQSGRQAGMLKAGLGNTLKDHELVDFTTLMSDIKPEDAFNQGSGVKWIGQMVAKMSRQVGRGFNPDSLRLAEDMYKYSLANPGKPINVIGFSAGGAAARDAAYMMNELGVKVKVITMGHGKFGITPEVSPTMSFINKADKKLWGKIAGKNATFLDDGDAHSPKAYLNSKGMRDRIKGFFDGDDKQ